MDTVKVRLYTHKSFRHYGGREINTTPYECNAIFIANQADSTVLVELSQPCAGFKQGHKIAVQPKDFNI